MHPYKPAGLGGGVFSISDAWGLSPTCPEPGTRETAPVLACCSPLPLADVHYYSWAELGEGVLGPWVLSGPSGPLPLRLHPAAGDSQLLEAEHWLILGELGAPDGGLAGAGLEPAGIWRRGRAEGAP